MQTLWVLLMDWEYGDAAGLYQSREDALYEAGRLIRELLTEAEDEFPEDYHAILSYLIQKEDWEELIKVWHAHLGETFIIKEVTVGEQIDPDKWMYTE